MQQMRQEAEGERMLTEGTKLSFEDRRELERNIKELENEIETNYQGQSQKAMNKIKELRQLRRMRYVVEEE